MLWTCVTCALNTRNLAGSFLAHHRNAVSLHSQPYCRALEMNSQGKEANGMVVRQGCPRRRNVGVGMARSASYGYRGASSVWTDDSGASIYGRSVWSLRNDFADVVGTGNRLAQPKVSKKTHSRWDRKSGVMRSGGNEWFILQRGVWTLSGGTELTVVG